MESTNNNINHNNNNLHSQHHHKLQDHHHLPRSSIIPSSLDFPSLSVEDNSEHAWRSSSTFFLNNNIHANANNSGEASSPNNNTFNNSMIQDLRYSLPNNNNSNMIQSSSSHLISNKIKEESSTSSDQSNSCSSFQTFGELLSPSTHHHHHHTPSPTEMLLLNTSLSPTNYKNHMFQHPSTFQPSIMQFHDNNNNNNNSNSNSSSDLPGITSFSQIFPSVNISKLIGSSSTSSMDSSHFRGGAGGSDLRFMSCRNNLNLNNNQAPNNSNLLELFKDSSQYGSSVDHDLQHSNDLRLCNATTSPHLSSFNNNGVLVEPKRTSCIVEPSANPTHHQSASKKQRFDTHPPNCPPFKVRKEKLGDRIAALQQLVAPFGKTDTASVLSEAIGYIKFLQNQIETLSVPYMKLGSRSKSSNNLNRISDEDVESEANKQNLRSRGLCLVPVTCTSYIINDCEISTAANAWPPPHSFHPGF